MTVPVTDRKKLLPIARPNGKIVNTFRYPSKLTGSGIHSIGMIR